MGSRRDTPAVAVAAATRPEQKVVSGTIADIADRLQQAPHGRSVLVMIGRALADAVADAWMSTSRAADAPPAGGSRSPERAAC